jgi:hypothetical protein
MGRMRVWVVLGVAVGLGLIIAWVDSRPTWDDAGITAAAIILVTAILGLILPGWAWLWALAVGGWIPALGIALHGNFGSLLALVIAFAGAYAGALGRKGFTALAQSSGQ